MSDDEVENENLARLLLGALILIVGGAVGFGILMVLRAVQYAIVNWHVWGPRIIGAVAFIVASYLVGWAVIYVFGDNDE